MVETMKRIKKIPYDECHQWHMYRDVKTGEEYGTDSTSLGKLVGLVNELSRKVEPVVSLWDGVHRAENWDELLDEIDLMFTQDSFIDCWVAVDVLFLKFKHTEKVWKIREWVNSTLKVREHDYILIATQNNNIIVQFNLLQFIDKDVCE